MISVLVRLDIPVLRGSHVLRVIIVQYFQVNIYLGLRVVPAEILI